MKTIIALVLALPAHVALAQQGKVEITRADVDVAAGVLFVDRGGLRHAARDRADRQVRPGRRQSHSPTDLVAALPQGIQSGTYRLVVVRAPGNASASMDVTIGAEETQGRSVPWARRVRLDRRAPWVRRARRDLRDRAASPGRRGRLDRRESGAGEGPWLCGPMGPAGPQGEQGVAGQIGPMGAGRSAGATGLSGLEQISLAETVNAGATATQEVVVACPSGKKAIAGGARSAISNAFFGTHPADDGRNWIGEFRRLSTPYEGKVWVICAVVAE